MKKRLHKKSNRENIPIQNICYGGDMPFLIRPIRSEVNSKDSNENPHRHNFIEIIWIKSGVGKHIIDDKVLSLKQNTFYLIKQGQIHIFLEGHNLNGMIIRYSKEFLLPDEKKSLDKFYTFLCDYTPSDGAITFCAEEAIELETILLLLLDEYKRPNTSFGRKEITRHLLTAFLLKLERKNREIAQRNIETTKDIEKQLYNSFLELLEENFTDNQSVDFFAKKLGISRRKTSDIVMQFTGKSAKTLIIEKQLLEAKRLLTYSNKTPKEIAYHLGYSSMTYFSRIFKKKTGKTPKELRLELKDLA